jgi:hypothetical protein
MGILDWSKVPRWVLFGSCGRVLGVSFRGSLAVTFTMMMIHGTGCSRYIDEAVILPNLPSFGVVIFPVLCHTFGGHSSRGWLRYAYAMHCLFRSFFSCRIPLFSPFLTVRSNWQSAKVDGLFVPLRLPVFGFFI